ncbi:PSD1 and planctomycete cytochrome C domain-containing protein [Planctomicrobium sp. SH664]|uniref:PSD1 and planctomycete cytochrome C domain-containing protein n=1 Tax=Planctomicrobium sp. SH664 TaxID=3448125 RepID=UPI003F5B2A96
MQIRINGSGKTRYRRALVLLAIAISASASGRAAEPLDFNRDVRPILSDKCISCHGPDAAHRAADLRLDDRESAVDFGAIQPGDPHASLMIQRITAEEESERMPPPESGKKLSPGEIEILQRWIREGAPYAPHWAYVPPRWTDPPATKQPTANWIDAFVFSPLERAGREPAPAADPRTLVRRLNFDLTGLPPTPEEAQRFIESKDPAAYDQLVEQLMASHHYGERMAIFWLDLVRYADTVGYHGDQLHSASPYRDYVIDAFNRNLPFDQFTREQIAGDLLPEPSVDQIVATCYNRVLQTSHEGGLQPKEYVAIYAADRVRNISAVWMGATLGCAQCHDHKYDPYTAKDFYALAAFFADVDDEKHLNGDGNADKFVVAKRKPEMMVNSRRERERLAVLEKQIAALGSTSDAAPSEELAALTAERDAILAAKRRVMITESLVTPRIQRILPRGDWMNDSGEIVEPAVPEFMGTAREEGRATRLDLANWLVDTENGIGGLTARVFVNRVWALFFGAGLSHSLEDFGGQGEPPTHPELLDNLAVEFIRSGWDVKQLVRLIVSSAAYRQSSVVSWELQAEDPENRLLAHQQSWRLPAESIRDTALFVSGLLVDEPGGESAKPYQPAGYYRYLNFPRREYLPHEDRNQWRRGVYMHWQRQFLHPMLKAFDAPSREECTAKRNRSNTPIAALVLLNDPSFVECSRMLAARTMKSGQETDSDRLNFAFRQVTSRDPDQVESEALQALLQGAREDFNSHPGRAESLLSIGLSPSPPELDKVELAAWTSVCRALLNLSETMRRE